MVIIPRILWAREVAGNEVDQPPCRQCRHIRGVGRLCVAFLQSVRATEQQVA